MLLFSFGKVKKVKKVKKNRKKVVTRHRRTVGGSKRVSSTRKSPEESATLFSVGTVKTGNDGNKWVIKKASNGVKRWIKKSGSSFGKKKNKITSKKGGAPRISADSVHKKGFRYMKGSNGKYYSVTPSGNRTGTKRWKWVLKRGKVNKKYLYTSGKRKPSKPTYTVRRKTPKSPASRFTIGTIRKGRDSNYWIVQKSNRVKGKVWVKY